MAEEIKNLSVDCFNPFLYSLLVNSFETQDYSVDGSANQNQGIRIDFTKAKTDDFIDLFIHVACWKEIEDCGVQEYVREKLGDVLSDVNASGVDLALHITRDEFTKGGEDYLRNVASIQQYILGAPFHKYFKALQEEKLAGLPTKILHFSPNESIIIAPKAASVSVVFTISEEEDTDRSLMQVFLLEFSEAKRVVAGGPSVNFVRDEPVELRGCGVEKPSVGYLVFSFNRDHVTEGRLDSVCELMTSFRFYLDYHIKSSKTYIHNRMRNRAEQWKNLLREARFEEENVQRTTMSGKTFVK
ncbi:ARP2/3 complex 34 kDa subunit [Blastocystis sp. ATCC 50177/Nand II]|uniref:Arp2/3 complex 34 kDa subunit n=1 Tax=Blastocystis sp. subtype 1 (strain ATCC 50177 / NandII) TaxID=478820 RepID=A0A196SKR5_BLAHN|nr:ARP2/3 complex 34 kDa subunit [Blastocystis sp. ATCC 50177/Nand II]